MIDVASKLSGQISHHKVIIEINVNSIIMLCNPELIPKNILVKLVHPINLSAKINIKMKFATHQHKLATIIIFFGLH